MCRTTTTLLAILALAAGCAKADGAPVDGIDRLTERIEKLESMKSKFDSMEAFLTPIMAEQQARRDRQAASEPDPEARFAIDIRGNAAEGPEDALVTIVEAFDFACPYCQKVSSTLPALVAEYNGNVRVVYKNFVIHPDTAMDAHLAGCAADKQGKFKAFTDAFWAEGFAEYAKTNDPAAINKSAILGIAQNAGLDAKALAKDMSSEACKALIAKDMADLKTFNVSGTPSFYVNGKFVTYAGPDEMRKIIDEELKFAEASGVPAADYYENVVMGDGLKEFRSVKDAAESSAN